MTCKERLKKERPELVNDDLFVAGCAGCPHDYNYMDKDFRFCDIPGVDGCVECWNRKIPETKSTNPDVSWNQIKELIDDAMEKRDRSVSIYISPDNGMSVNVSPWPDGEELYEMYKEGKITFNEFREKIGLPPMNEEDFVLNKE